MSNCGDVDWPGVMNGTIAAPECSKLTNQSLQPAIISINNSIFNSTSFDNSSNSNGDSNGNSGSDYNNSNNDESSNSNYFNNYYYNNNVNNDHNNTTIYTSTGRGTINQPTPAAIMILNLIMGFFGAIAVMLTIGLLHYYFTENKKDQEKAEKGQFYAASQCTTTEALLLPAPPTAVMAGSPMTQPQTPPNTSAQMSRSSPRSGSSRSAGY